jgi:hypothetical protein
MAEALRDVAPRLAVKRDDFKGLFKDNKQANIF